MALTPNEQAAFDEFNRELTDEMKDMSRFVDNLVKEVATNDGQPGTLYHFTDCAGLCGILESKSLRASLATALSDASETKYAINSVKSKVLNGEVALDHLPAELLTRSLDGEPLVEGTHDFRSYVTSFCEATEAAHWLHYGRSGTGVAIAFDGSKLPATQFDLCRIIYDADRQHTLLSKLIGRVDEAFGRWKNRVTGEGEQHFARVFSHLAFGYLRFISPRMKDDAFHAEHEWRLVSNEAWVGNEPAANPTRNTRFRTTAGRIVPFKTIAYDPLPVERIVLGASCPMSVTEQGLAVLMEEGLGQKVPVERSPITVRP